MEATGQWSRLANFLGLALMVTGALLPTSVGEAYRIGGISAEMLNWRLVSAISGSGMFVGGSVFYGASRLTRILVALNRAQK